MAKRHGVRLILGGAPPSPHVVAGFRGYVRPDIPTPVGEPGDAIEDLAEARAFVSERSDVLELVEIPTSKVKAAEGLVTADIKAGRKGIADARRDGRASDDRSRTDDELQAVRKETR